MGIYMDNSALTAVVLNDAFNNFYKKYNELKTYKAKMTDLLEKTKSGQYLEEKDRQFAEEQGVLRMMDPPTVPNPMSISLYDGTNQSQDKIVKWFMENKQFNNGLIMAGLLRYSIYNFARTQAQLLMDVYIIDALAYVHGSGIFTSLNDVGVDKANVEIKINELKFAEFINKPEQNGKFTDMHNLFTDHTFNTTLHSKTDIVTRVTLLIDILVPLVMIDVLFVL